MGFVSECPKSQTEVGLASKRLGCDSDKYGNNQYICAPNDSKTSLVEICIDGIMGIQNKGNWKKKSANNFTLKLYMSNVECNINICCSRKKIKQHSIKLVQLYNFSQSHI